MYIKKTKKTKNDIYAKYVDKPVANPGGGGLPPSYKCLRCSKLEFFSKIYF